MEDKVKELLNIMNKDDMKQYIEKYAKQYNGVHKDNSLVLLDMPYTNLSRKVYTGVFNEIEELLKLKLEQFS